MATYNVPIYDGPKVQQAAAPSGKVNIQSSPDAFGGAVAQGLVQWSETFVQEGQRADESRIDDKRRQLLPKLTELKAKLSLTKGEEALKYDENKKDATARTQDEFTKIYDELTKDLTPGQKAKFEKEKLSYQTNLAEFGASHRANEQNKFDRKSSQVNVVEGSRFAFESARMGDPAGIQTGKFIADMAVRKLASLEGIPQNSPQFKAFQTEHLSSFHAGVLEAYLSNGNRAEVANYYNQNRDELDAKAKTHYGKVVTAANDDTEGLRFAASQYGVMAEKGVTAAMDAVNNSSLSPEAKQAARSYLSNRKQTLDYDKKVRVEASVDGMFAKHNAMGLRVLHTDEWQAFKLNPDTAKEANQMQSTWEREARIRANEATEKDLIGASTALSAEMMKPDVMHIDLNEAEKRARTLGDKTGARFMEWWRSAQMQGAVSVVDRDTVISEMRNAGLNEKAIKTSYAEVETLVRADLGRRGTAAKPTTEEVAATARKLLRPVVLKGKVWGENKLPRFQLDTPEEVKLAMDQDVVEKNLPKGFTSALDKLVKAGQFPANKSGLELFDMWYDIQEISKKYPGDPLVNPDGTLTPRGMKVLPQLYQ